MKGTTMNAIEPIAASRHGRRHAPSFRAWTGVAGLACAGLLLAGCGGKAPAAAGASDAELSIGIFVDNAFGDGDFFDQAAKAQASLEEGGAAVNTYEGQLQAQNFAPLLQDAADANDLVFVLGFEAIDALIDTAAENPDTTFVFLDGVVDSAEVVSAEFRTAEGCFMAGALAATVNGEAGADTAGFIGGVNAPVIQNCEAGYVQGVEHVAPDMKVAAQYVGSFVDPAKGREIGLALKNKGAYAQYAYAGLSGAGIFDAAKSGQEIAPIGIVTDKSSLAPGKVPGSVEMKVDAVIEQLTEDFTAGTLKQGSQQSYGFAEDGWGMVYDEKILGADNVAALSELEAKIASGEVKVNVQ
ncbi:BMP family ABC transporter substrate-binding protein [Arthrobacter sp. CAU 1506]|nr:BMP family ABC transporter substrate-binding protein [Arthrobacter sp. CAU 1506]